MQPASSLQLTVEAPACGIRVIRVAGELHRASSARLGKLIDAQVRALVGTLAAHVAGHVVIDLGNVRFFGIGGLEVLLTARDVAHRTGMGIHLAGLGARELLLPLRVIDMLVGFSMFATVEQALAILLEPTTGSVPEEVQVSPAE